MCIHLVTLSRAATFSRMIAVRKDAMLPRMKSGLDYRSESSMTIAGCIVHYEQKSVSHLVRLFYLGLGAMKFFRFRESLLDSLNLKSFEDLLN